ncbi:TlpA family protein disulfide reductase [Pedobacter aquatilis]|uniref:TlpA family protein disulfide reductase n=1 Tax=Pedobacter aquatilis TaxID=351343 RepID=UPI00292E10D3|nr:thioredoxin-like domain-containing protein [Pedobacter aquatilis]
MKCYLTLYLLLFINYSYAHAQRTFDVKDSTTIYGKVVDFNPLRNDKLINFYVNDILGTENVQSVQIKNDGSYRFTFFRPFDSDMQIEYNNEIYIIYASSKEPLQLNISANLPIPSVQAIGNNATSVLSNLITTYSVEFYKHDFEIKNILGNKELTDSSFNKKRIALYQEQVKFAEQFNAEYSVSDKNFLNWQKNNLIFSLAEDLAANPFYGRINTRIDFPELFVELDKLKLNSFTSNVNRNYYKFLRSLEGAFEIIVNINPNYESEKLKNGKNPLPVYLGQVDKYLSGVLKQLLYYHLCYVNSADIDLDNSDFKHIKAILINDYLINSITNKIKSIKSNFQSFDVLEKIKSLKFEDSLKVKILTLFEKYSGNNIYLDFWGDWCGPCMSEMPHYKNLISRLKPEKIINMFISAYTKDESVQDIKKKFAIDGVFYNLSRDEISILQNVFSFHSYPKHFLIKDNRVFSEAGGIGGNNIEAISNEIIKKFNSIGK